MQDAVNTLTDPTKRMWYDVELHKKAQLERITGNRGKVKPVTAQPGLGAAAGAHRVAVAARHPRPTTHPHARAHERERAGRTPPRHAPSHGSLSSGASRVKPLSEASERGL